MYNPIYNIPFTSVDGQDYNVQISVEGATDTPETLVAGTPPFKVEIDDEAFLYTPTRFSGATLKIVGGDYLQKLFSTDYQGCKVNLFREGSLVWTGFISPEVYSQDFDNSLFEFEIECVSALSTLEYIDFKWDGDFVSFLDIINMCVTESKGDFNGVYIPEVYNLNLDSITVSRNNFFDEDGKAMTLKECIGEVCKFLNWTVCDADGSVYFIDVDYIQKGKTEYVNKPGNQRVSLSSAIDIRDLASKGNGNSLSILGGYNKATVIASDYEVEPNMLFPEITCDTIIGEKTIKADSSGKKDKDDCTYELKWYLCDKFDTHTYEYSGSGWMEHTTEATLVDIGIPGSRIMKFFGYRESDKPTSPNWETMIEIKMTDGGGHMLDDSSDGDTTGELDIYKLQHGEAYHWEKPILSVKPSEQTNMLFPEDSYLGISFSVCLTPSLRADFRGIPVNLEHKKDKIKDILENSYKLDGVNDGNLWKYYYVPIKIKIGEKWFDGERWGNEEKFLNVPLDVSGGTHLEGKWIGIKNNNTFDLGVSKLGDCFVVPIKEVLSGKLELTVGIPCMPARGSGKRYIHIRNLRIESARANMDEEKKEKQDTKYTNVVNEAYINECDDIEFKITSKNDSELSFSKAIIYGDIIDRLPNVITGVAEKPEEFMIQRIVGQYKQPKIKLVQEVEPKILPYSIVTCRQYLPGKRFFFTGGTIDYENNSAECNLVELN